MSGVINGVGSRSGCINTTGSFRRSAFLVRYGVTAWHTTSNSKIPFGQVTGGHCHNIGNDFDITNHRYIAPSTGLYTFTMSMYSFEARTSNYFLFKINGSSLSNGGGDLTNMANQGHAGDRTLCQSITIDLNTKDYVEVWASGDVDYYAGHTYFGGTRLN